MVTEIENVQQLTGKQCRELLYKRSKKVGCINKNKKRSKKLKYFVNFSASTNSAGLYISSFTGEYTGATARKVNMSITYLIKFKAFTFIFRIAVFKKRPVKDTFFKIYWRRGDIPVTFSGKLLRKKNTRDFPLKWFCPPEKLDYCYYLPIFVDG